MPLRPGTRFSHYEVLEPIGAGGMGEVYRARDTKLGRDVAIKTLPEAFMADAERLARFEREARLLASLSHPHIGAIYGVEEVDGVRGLVLELIEGETLAERRTTRSTAEALAIARQVAEALDAAHDRGIIHRDLKPANIKLPPDGIVKVLDFGLAKAIAGLDADVDLSASPTGVAYRTREDVILGTAAYMSPEQARGRPVDKRTDIWSFGCVLYELLTGRRAFKGDTVSDTIGAILRDTPDWRALPADTPVLIRRLLRRCLEKDSTRRLRDIGDASLEIAEALATPAIETGDAAAQAVGAPGAMRWVTWTASVVLAAVITGVGVWWVVRPVATTPPSVLRLSMLVPAFNTGASGIAVSRDGTKLVYRGDRPGATSDLLYLRTLDGVDPEPISGTEHATQPFFSPDGESIAFFYTNTLVGGRAREGQLKKVSTRGGPPVVLADAVALGGSWASDNTIVFSRTTANGIGLFRISASGGTPEPLTEHEDKGERHAWPDHLPGGRAILFSITNQPTFNEGRIAVLSLATGQYRTVVEQGHHARYLKSGHLAYILNGDLMTVPFDHARLMATGPPVRSVGAVDSEPVLGDAGFGVSEDGLLAYATENDGPGPRTLSWVTREGIRTPLSFEPDHYAYPRISPDGRRLALQIDNRDIWVVDLARSTRTRITSGDRGLQPPPAYMTWTPDSRHLTFNRRIDAPGSTIEWVNPFGSERSTVLLKTPHFASGGTWSPDGKVLAFFQFLPATRMDLWVMEPGDDRQPRPFLVTPADERGPQFSPDGRWIAYVSNASGRDEVLMKAYPGPSGAIPVSSGGGSEPVWSRDGRELFYRQGGRLMAVSIDGAATPSLRSPRLLFEAPYQTDPMVGLPNYDVAPDGRFLMVSEPPPTIVRFTIVQNWFEELKRRVPPP